MPVNTWTTWAVTLTGGTAQNYYIRSINFLNESIGYTVDRASNAVDNDY